MFWGILAALLALFAGTASADGGCMATGSSDTLGVGDKTYV